MSLNESQVHGGGAQQPESSHFQVEIESQQLVVETV